MKSRFLECMAGIVEHQTVVVVAHRMLMRQFVPNEDWFLPSDWVWDRDLERGLSSQRKTTFICQNCAYNSAFRALSQLWSYLPLWEEWAAEVKNTRPFLTGENLDPWNWWRWLSSMSIDQDGRWRNSTASLRREWSRKVWFHGGTRDWEINPALQARPNCLVGNGSLMSVERSHSADRFGQSAGDIDSEFYLYAETITKRAGGRAIHLTFLSTRSRPLCLLRFQESRDSFSGAGSNGWTHAAGQDQ